jgi:hypothetical protein
MNPIADDLFDGLLEINSRLERGQSFGVPKGTYLRLAHASLNVAQCGVEPCSIHILPDGSPGCVVDLFGNVNAYAIEVAIVPLLRIVLRASPLDCAQAQGEEIFSGTDCEADWDQIVRRIFAAEGCFLATSHSAKEIARE